MIFRASRKVKFQMNFIYMCAYLSNWNQLENFFYLANKSPHRRFKFTVFSIVITEKMWQAVKENLKSKFIFIYVSTPRPLEKILKDTKRDFPLLLEKMSETIYILGHWMWIRTKSSQTVYSYIICVKTNLSLHDVTHGKRPYTFLL